MAKVPSRQVLATHPIKTLPPLTGCDKEDLLADRWARLRRIEAGLSSRIGLIPQGISSISSNPDVAIKTQSSLRLLRRDDPGHRPLRPKHASARLIFLKWAQS